MNGNGQDPLGRISALPDDPLPEAVIDAIRELAERLKGTDSVTREAFGEAAIKLLKERKVGRAARLVDAGLRLQRDAAEAAEGFLEAPQPWHEAVDGATLLDEIRYKLGRYLALPDHADVAIALWCVLAHVHDAFFVSPILLLSSPVKRCGKTTAMLIVNAIVPKPLQVGSMTPAALFRVVEAHQPTLLLDEGDTYLRDNEEIRGVINSGHARDAAFVARVEGDDRAVKLFKTWCPKCIAMIGKPPDTIEDRSVMVPMRRRSPAEQIARFRSDKRDGLAILRRIACRWAQDNGERLAKLDDPEMPAEIGNDRARDNWRPLLAIADLAGGPWPELARQAAVEFAGGAEAESAAILLLGDLRDMFKEGADLLGEPPKALESKSLVEKLVKMEERPWPEWKNGRPITTRQLARLLKPFEVKPKSVRDGPKVFKGYLHSELAPVFERYLPPDRLHQLHTENDEGNAESDRLQPDSCVTDRHDDEGSDFNGVTVVTVGNPPTEEERA